MAGGFLTDRDTMNRNPKRDLPGVRYCEGCRYTDQYTGTKQALIAAGIAQANWFPTKLVKAMRVDGKPYMGNNGKQRTQRRYWIEGITPETSITHRVNPDGQEVWIVAIANEQRREEAERQHQEWLRERSRCGDPYFYLEPKDRELRRDVLPVPRKGQQFDVRGWVDALAAK